MKQLLLFMLLLSGFAWSGYAEDPPSAAAFLTKAQIVVTDTYADRIKGADFISGNKIKGSIQSVDKNFVAILAKSEGETKTILIPISEILYITGKQRIVNF